MGKVISGVIVVVLLLALIGQFRYFSVGISAGDDEISVPPDHFRWYALAVDEEYDGENVEARLDLRHFSGPAINVYVLDKRNFELLDAYGWDALSIQSFGPVHRDLQAIAFNSQLETDWISIGKSKPLYLVISNLSSQRSALVSASLDVRHD